jgi:CheY-like chemotaxis protein
MTLLLRMPQVIVDARMTSLHSSHIMNSSSCVCGRSKIVLPTPDFAFTFSPDGVQPMTISMPVYQHPTSVVLVDDSASFIASVEYQLKPSLAVKSFQDAHEALAWLGRLYHADEGKCLPIRIGYDEQTFSFERRTIALDVDQVYRIVMDSERFQTAAVVVVDYAMSAINGLDFCRALRGLPCKKILFTGEANEMIAVEAFNQGLIDRYLKKGDPSAMDRLESEIETLEHEYFIERSGFAGTAHIFIRLR